MKLEKTKTAKIIKFQSLAKVAVSYSQSLLSEFLIWSLNKNSYKVKTLWKKKFHWEKKVFSVNHEEVLSDLYNLELFFLWNVWLLFAQLSLFFLQDVYLFSLQDVALVHTFRSLRIPSYIFRILYMHNHGVVENVGNNQCKPNIADNSGVVLNMLYGGQLSFFLFRRFW